MTAETAASSSASVLLVDDDESMGMTLQKILSKGGLQVEWMTTGGGAVAAARKTLAEGRRLDVALIDIRLPDMSGLDVLREIKKACPDASGVMMTGYADTETAVRALNDGAFAYVTKPYNIDEVKAIICRATERQRLLGENRVLLERLKEANAVLEKKVQQRTEQLQRANLQLANTIEKLQEAAAVKSEFMSMITHELRTPLAVILGYSERLQQGAMELTDEQKTQCLEHIIKDSRRLDRLISDILNLSTVQERALTFTFVRFDMRALVEHVVQGIAVIKGGATFKVEIPDALREVVCDRDRLEQVLVNLLGNAAKYTPEEGVIRVVAAHADEDIVVSVVDEGPGIPEVERAKIFEAFYRTRDAINRKRPGTGLGLTITKVIVETLGGRIWVEPGPGGKGSRFSFTLPRNQAPDVAPA